MFSKNEGNEFSNERKGSSKKIIKFFKSTKDIALLAFILVCFGNISSPACSEDHEEVISNQTSVIDSQKQK